MISPDPRLRFSSHDAVIQALQKSERMLRGERERWGAKAALVIAGATLITLLVFGWIFVTRRAPATAPATTSATSALDTEREFDEGRRQIVDGRYATARATFTRLVSATKNKQPIHDWALLNLATAALLDQQESQASEALH
jgi:outer membrane protein assembly factor BamD (BamD/ComL family)